MADPHDAVAGQPGAIRYAFTRDVVRRSSFIALVVGCLLTLTNQFDVLFSGPYTLRLGVKIVLNFLIPFAVASVSAAMNRKREPR